MTKNMKKVQTKGFKDTNGHFLKLPLQVKKNIRSDG